MTKQRITFLSNFIGEESVNTEGLEFSEESLTVPKSTYYSRQDRLTVPQEEIPHELKKLLKNFKEVRITWKAPGTKASEVFQNFNQEGLFIHLLPSVPNYQPIIDELSQYLSTNLGLELFNNSNFITTATSFTYYTPKSFQVELLQQFISFVSKTDTTFGNTQDFELHYSSTRGLKIQTISSPSDTIINSYNGIRKEIAILQPKKSIPDIELSGIRTILSKDSTEYLPPTKTLIYIKPRHFQTASTLNWELNQPIGLHPTLKTQLEYNPPHSDHCKLFWISTLPNRLIFDKYQYNGRKFQLLSSWGETDLEAPEWNVSKFGSIQFLEVLNSNTSDIEMTYHSRYITPSSNGTTNFLTPQLFYACDGEKIIEDYEQIELNPFDNYGLGFDSFFESDTVFFHLDNGNEVLKFDIPTADVNDYFKVQLITLSVVFLGGFYLLFKLFKAFTTTTTKIDSKKRA